MGRSKGKGKRYQDDSAAAVVEEDANEAIVEEEESSSDDDSSQSSSSSSSSSSSTSDDSGDSPTPSDLNNGKRQDASTQATPSNSKTWDSMDGYEVRQNALKLLNVSPDANETKKGGTDERKSMNSVTYQSYHDSPYSTGSQSMERPANFPNMHSSQYTSSVQPTWGDSRYNDANNVDDDSLSVYHIASLTFNCMVHCLTEGYRAASTYYNNYAEDSGPSHTGGFRSTASSYEHVGSYQDNSYSGVSSGQSHYREVMERDSSQPKPPEAEEEGDWGTTVKLPSTYQGKK